MEKNIVYHFLRQLDCWFQGKVDGNYRQRLGTKKWRYYCLTRLFLWVGGPLQKPDMWVPYLKRVVKQQLVFQLYETDGWTKKRPALPRCGGCHLRPWHHLLTTGLGFLTSPKGAKIRMLGAGGKVVPGESSRPKQSGWSLWWSMAKFGRRTDFLGSFI